MEWTNFKGEQSDLPKKNYYGEGIISFIKFGWEFYLNKASMKKICVILKHEAMRGS